MIIQQVTNRLWLHLLSPNQLDLAWSWLRMTRIQSTYTSRCGGSDSTTRFMTCRNSTLVTTHAFYAVGSSLEHSRAQELCGCKKYWCGLIFLQNYTMLEPTAHNVSQIELTPIVNLYSISYTYYSCLGFIGVLVVGIIVSLASCKWFNSFMESTPPLNQEKLNFFVLSSGFTPSRK